MSDWLVRYWPSKQVPPVQPMPSVVVVKDKVPEIKVSIPDTRPVAMMPNVNNTVLGYHNQRMIGRGAFQPPEYNLAEMGRIEDTDSYVRQAFDKKTALMFKEGWSLVGKNPRTIKYVKTRLAQIAHASNISTNSLFRNIGSNIVRKSNAFLLKARKVEASGGRIRNQPGTDISLKPVAGYFPIPAETMEFQLTGTKISRWQQKMPNGEFKKLNVKNVIHIHFDRKDGFVFGTPGLIPVIDDIRALRKIEENIELLVYQHLFPLFHYKVGTENNPAGWTEDGKREIDIVKQEIQFMPTEGGIVTPERHEITAIGVEGRALRAEGYLDHFKNRVFSGLGVSAVDMGEGDTANRATADNMSRNLVDAVKDLQQIVEDAINHEIIDELLLESTFGTSVLDEDNIVRLEFKEIDVEAQIKKEAHGADLFDKNIIEQDEARARLGLEPWVIPTPEEAQSGNDTPEAFPQWHKSRWKMFDLPKLLIQALDEPYSPIAQASAADSSLPVTTASNEEAGKKQNEQEISLEKEKTKAKVAVAKAKPSLKKKDGYLQSTFAQTKKDIVKRVSQNKTIDHDWIATLIRTQLNTTVSHLLAEQLLAFRKSYATIGSVETEKFVASVSVARLQLRERAEHFVNKLVENVISSLRRNVTIGSEDIVTKTRAVFESVEFRTKFIEDVEIRKAASLGKAMAIRDTATSNSIASFVTNESACPTCISKNAKAISLHFLSLDNLPPHHANCSCMLEETQQQLSFVNNVNQIVDKRQEDVETEDTEDSIKRSKHAKFRRCVSKIKARIKSKNPTINNDVLEAQAEAACGHLRESLDEEVLDDISVEDATLMKRTLSVEKSLSKEKR